MSCRRRHFPFGNKSPSPNDSKVDSSPSSYEMGKSRFHLSLPDSTPYSDDDAESFVTNLHKCVSSCSTYTQALNSLCTTGTNFAECLVKLFKNLHPYQEIAGQFQEIWEKISQATGSASAAVKTETLINLQEILTRLENNNNSQFDIRLASLVPAETIQILFSCLSSFLQLQALFSCSSWELLNQLLKDIDDPIIDVSSPQKSQSEAIFGHFKSLLGQSDAHQSSTPHILFSSKPVIENDQDFSSYQNPPSNNVTTSPEHAWKSTKIQSNEPSRSQTPNSSASSPKKTPFHCANRKNVASADELQDVLELLSCAPDTSKNLNQSSSSLTSVNFKNHNRQCESLQKTGSQQGLPVGFEKKAFQDFGKRTWPRTCGSVNPANWGWMFSQSDNQSMFQFDASKSMDSQAMNVVNNVAFNSAASTVSQTLMQHNAIDEPYLPTALNQNHVTGVCHQKQTSDISTTSDGHTKSWSSTQCDSSSSSDDVSPNDTENVFSIGLNIDVSNLVASVGLRRHSSIDRLPDIVNVCPVPPFTTADLSLDNRISKTSTWPLKHHPPNANQEAPTFANQDSVEYTGVASNCPELWNGPARIDSYRYPPLGNGSVEKYSLFGKSN